MAFGDILSETGSARLLIVEDDVLLASSLEELLSVSGFEVVGVAGSAATALSLAGERHPALALIDICLVGPVDGIELACKLREQYRMPAIFLSGLTDPERQERTLQVSRWDSCESRTARVRCLTLYSGRSPSGL
jgi:DNA-binding response OmpR family regulator